jgi:hypothetical protein
MTNLPERGALGVRELEPPFQLGLQDAVFCGQIFIPRQQFLVHRPRDVGQDARPIHLTVPLAPAGMASLKCTGLALGTAILAVDNLIEIGRIDVLVHGNDPFGVGGAVRYGSFGSAGVPFGSLRSSLACSNA